jgi:hypothetical protein
LSKSSPASSERIITALRTTSEALLALAGSIDPVDWMRVPSEAEWSIGKEVEHVADGTVLHEWVIRTSVGRKAGARPRIERERLTAQRPQPEVIALVRRRVDEWTALLQELSAVDLSTPPRPPRGRAATVAELIESLLIGHIETHRRSIESKLQRTRL